MEPVINNFYFSARLQQSCKVVEVDKKSEMCKISYDNGITHNFGNGTGWITWATFNDLSDE